MQKSRLIHLIMKKDKRYLYLKIEKDQLVHQLKIFLVLIYYQHHFFTTQ